jgi:murein DD-endopeptidase MepM/ murein hydrolase activator NlpD
MPPIPQEGEPGAFGAKRRFDIHTGVDLYACEGEPVLAVEDGIVTYIQRFTGEEAGSPWWLSTDAVLIEGASGVVLYGEVTPRVQPNMRVIAGDVIGQVKRVLRHDKGTPTSMLHLELYAPGVKDGCWWRLDEPKPAELRDPTELLLGAK